MNWKIIYQDEKERKEFLIDNEEYQEISKWLNKPKMVKLKSGIILNMAFIRIIEPDTSQEIISKEFRLPEPKFKRIDATKPMERMFNFLKTKGLFKEYQNYQEWYKAKYANNFSNQQKKD